LRILVERALQDCFPTEDSCNLIPPLNVLVIPDVAYAGDGRLVRLNGLNPRIIDSELLKVSQDRKRQLRAPRIPTKLIGWIDAAPNVNRRLFGLDEELAHTADPEAVVRSSRLAPDLQGILVDDVFVGFCVPAFIVNVPAERFEERIY